MSQFSDKLLRYMVSEYHATGKNHFDYVNMLNPELFTEQYLN